MTTITIPFYDEFITDRATAINNLPEVERLTAIKSMLEAELDIQEYDSHRECPDFTAQATQAGEYGIAQAQRGGPCAPYDDADFVGLVSSAEWVPRTMLADVYCRAWRSASAEDTAATWDTQEPIYTHVFSLAFEVGKSLTADGSDVSGEQLKQSLQKRLDDLPIDEMVEACGIPEDTDLITFKLDNADHGYHDYDIENAAVLSRACVPFGIKIGEVFNVYYGDSSKAGCEWRGTLPSSLVGLDLEKL